MIYYVPKINIDKVYAHDSATNDWYFGNGDPTRPHTIKYFPCNSSKPTPPNRRDWEEYGYKKYQRKVSYLNREDNV